ncbi:MAG: branched-chain amino acid ABC transporter permease [Candidatus Hydrothermarchaeota archaeon]
MSLLAQLLVNGLVAGGIYALVAVGYTMVYGVLKFINFAHGELVMLGAFVTYTLAVPMGLGLLPAFLLAVPLVAVVGVVIERAAYRPLRRASRLAPLITAIGVSILLQSLAILLWGPEIRSFSIAPAKGMEFFGATVTPVQILIVLTSIALMGLLHLLVESTKMGKAMRATADSLETASVVGIDTDRVIAWVFALGSALACVAGVLIAMEENMEPTMGTLIGIKAFTAAVVGGIGNIKGAVVGGFLIGIVENLGIWKLPAGYKDAIAFVILMGILLFKPTGLFGERLEEVRQ